MTRKLPIFLLVLTILCTLALASCDPISGSAGTYGTATSDPFAQAVEADLNALTAARETREAR